MSRATLICLFPNARPLVFAALTPVISHQHIHYLTYIDLKEVFDLWMRRINPKCFILKSSRVSWLVVFK